VRKSPDEEAFIRAAKDAVREEPRREYRNGSQPDDFSEGAREEVPLIAAAPDVAELLRKLRAAPDNDTPEEPATGQEDEPADTTPTIPE
jgi:hypothetical protein